MVAKGVDLEHVGRKYRDRMLQLAFVASGWSGEPEGQKHGCVLALDGKYVVSIGFNGPNRYFPNGSAAPIVHAEMNALINARIVQTPINRCVAFVTKKPCRACFNMLRTTGMLAIFWLQNASGEDCRWVRKNGRLR